MPGIHKTDQAQVEPKISSSFQVFIVNLSRFLVQLELDPFCEYSPSDTICSFVLSQTELFHVHSLWLKNGFNVKSYMVLVADLNFLSYSDCCFHFLPGICYSLYFLDGAC